MSSIAFKGARVIDSAKNIPLLGWQDRINLVRTGNIAPEALRAGGAKGGAEKDWYITRSSNVLLEPLDAFLPQIARRAIVPNVVDLIPETSWCASLANMLTSRSWSALRDVALGLAGGCEDCGARDPLECHEMWSYIEATGVQKLTALRTVCKPCHETYHLGLASSRGRYGGAFERLMLINRIRKEEAAEFENEIFAKFVRRSEIEWILDLSLLAGNRLTVRPKFEEIAPNVLAGDSHMGEIEVSVVGVSIEPPAKPGHGLVFA